MLNDVSLYLHVGLHKTGSSAVQSYFTKNYNENIECGLLFPKFGFENTEYKGGRKGTTSGHNELIRVIFSKNNNTKKKFIEGIKNEAKNKKISKVFISCENISHHLSTECSKNIQELFDDFKDVKLIITVRHPVDFLDSYYKEVVTNGWDFECAKPKEFLKDNMSLIAYQEKFEKYDENFGVNNVIKVIYGDELFKLGIERVFSNILGVKYHGVIRGLVNKSSSVQYVNYVRRINSTLFNVNRMRCILNSVEDQSRTSGNNGYVFSSELVDFIIERFELINKSLSKYEFHTGSVKEVLGSPSKLGFNKVDMKLEYFDPSLAYEEISIIDVFKYLYRKSPIKFRKLILGCYFRMKR